MFRYDLRLAIRHLWRRKLYTIIILLSLAIGFGCTSLLITFLLAETHTDRFHANADRSFQVFTDDPFGGNGNIAYIPNYFPEYVKGNFPEVLSTVQVGTPDAAWLETEAGEFHDIQILSTDSTFFSIFSFPVIAGSTEKSLLSDRIILTEAKALALFGTRDVVGNMVTFKTADTLRTLQVSAVLGRSPENSHLVFDALVAHSVLRNKWYGGASYVLLNKASQGALLAEKINNDPQRPGLVGIGKAHYALEPLSESYFNAANKMTYMRMRNPLFIKIGIVACALVIFMASFNFISLFLLSLQGRKKEAGVKKMLGISWWNLLRSSFLEVAVYVVVAFGMAIALMSFLLPPFNALVESSLAFEYLSRVKVILWIGGIVLVLGMIVVLFSVVQQRQVKPISLMRNAGSSRVSFSKTLFTIQFMVSITLAICAVAIIQQMSFLENEPLGFNRNIIRLQSPARPLDARLAALKQDLLQINGVQHASVVSGNPVSGNWMARYDLEDGKFYTPFLFAGDEDMFATLNLTLLEGELPSATRLGKVVNEKLVKEFSLQHPVGEKVPGTEDRIIGVVMDFTCTSFKDEIQPAILSYSVDNSRLIVDYSGHSVGTLLPDIKRAWTKHFPDHVFNYTVVQEDLMKKYKDETFFYKTVVAFAITSLVISCFGLFALSWAVAQSRTREMGVRKVLGATGGDVMSLLTMSFLRHILIAFAIAAPVGYYLMREWLNHFARRIPLGASIFIIAGASVIMMAFFTMSIQTVKAARTNPVDELKND